MTNMLPGRSLKPLSAMPFQQKRKKTPAFLPNPAQNIPVGKTRKTVVSHFNILGQGYLSSFFFQPPSITTCS